MILSRSVGHWIISGNTGDPFSSPWVIFEAEIRRVKLKTLKDLMEVVTDFVGSLDEAEVRRAVRDVRPRAKLCIKMGGSHFDFKLQKYKRGTIEE